MRAGLACSQTSPRGRAPSISADVVRLAFVSGTKYTRPRARTHLNTQNAILPYYLSRKDANRQNSHVVCFSSRRRTEFDNLSWAIRCLTCCLIHQGSEVCDDLSKLVLWVASSDGTRHAWSNRYNQVCRHMSHESEIFKNTFQRRMKVSKTISECTSIIMPWF